MKKRQIDKQEFLGQGAELILEKQFKFKENMNIDFDHEKKVY